MADLLLGLANLYCEQGKYAEAESLFRASLTMARTVPNILDKIECLGGFASLFATRGDGVGAARLLGAVDAALQVIGMRLYFGDRFERARTLDVLCASLSEADAAAAWAEGKAMTLEQAIDYALNDTRSDSLVVPIL